MIVGTFSWGINNSFFIRSDLVRSCYWNFTSWVESWLLGFNTYNMALGPQCMRTAIVCTKIENLA